MKNINALKSLSQKEIKRVLRIWKQTLLPPVITTLLYFLIFWTIIWQRVWEMNWIDYIDFLIPWFIMMSLITASYSNVSSSFFGAKFQKSIEEILTSPMKNYEIILWFISGWIFRWLIIALIVFIISMFFWDIQIHNYLLMTLFLIFTSSLFSLAWFLNAFFAKSFDDVNIVPTFIIQPLVYLWWVFYSATLLTPIWQFITIINPIYYMVNGLRYSMLWVSEANVYISLIAIIIFNFILFYINMYLFKKWFLRS